jgi:hypothetical protein
VFLRAFFRWGVDGAVSSSRLSSMPRFASGKRCPYRSSVTRIDARERKRPSRPSGRPRVLAPEVVERIRAESAAGTSLAQIARDLDSAGTPTAHGGKRWWPSTVRSVVSRSSARA